jgi:hypothetical protein
LNYMRVKSLLLLTAFFFCSGQSRADGWLQEGSVSILTAYDSNPSLSPAYPGGSWIGSITPGYSLNGIFGENQYKAGLAYLIQRSSNTAVSSDRHDPTATLDWKRQSDLNEFGISTRYHESSTRTAEINNLGPNIADNNAFYRTFTGTWKRTLDQRSSFAADTSYQNVTYAGGIYTNYVARSADLMLKYELSELSAPFVKLSYIDYLPVNTSQLSHMNTVMLGWNWIASEDWQGDLQVGGSNGVNVPTNAQYEAALHYKGDVTDLDLSASRLTTLIGLYGFVLVDQSTGSWKYALSEFNRSGIEFGWRRNNYVIPITNSLASVWLEHDFNAGWKSRTYYVHRISNQSGVGTAYSNEVGITLVYTQIDF